MFVGLRMNDEVVAQIDAAATAKGVTRSRWIAALVAKELGSQPEQRKVRRRASGPPRQVHLRLDAAMADDMEHAASTFGMTRNQWIVSVLHGRLSDSEGQVVVSPISKEAIREALGQIVKIGRNVDQAVHAMNASAMPGSRLNPSAIASQLVDMAKEVRTVCEESRQELLNHLNAEQPYWKHR